MTDEADDPNKDDVTAADLLSDEPAAEPVRRTRKAKADAEVRLHPVLTDEDFLAAKAKAKARVDKDRRAAAMKAVEDEEAHRLQFEEGLTSDLSELSDIVHVTIDLPPWATNINLNGPRGRFYWHGHGYDVPRHVANSLSESMFRMWRHEDQVEGRDMKQQYARKRDTMINARTGAVANAPARFDA